MKNDPPINQPDYNKCRKSEGQHYIKWMPKVANKVREILDIPQDKHDWRISSIPVLIVKSEEKLSYW